MAVFTGRWTRGTILDQALKRVGNVKIKQLGRDQLNRLLEAVYSKWEWPFLYTTLNFTFPAANTGGTMTQFASTALPADFLKTQSETTGLRILARNGNAFNRPVVEVSPLEFVRIAIPNDQEGQAPRVFYCSLAESILYFWPRPTDTVSAQLVYKFLPDDMPIGTGDTDPVTIAYDADIPLFPWGGFLAKAMEQWAHTYEKDYTSAQVAQGEADVLFDMIRNIGLPRDSQEPTIPLDPRVFGPTFRDESTGWWPWRDEDW